MKKVLALAAAPSLMLLAISTAFAQTPGDQPQQPAAPVVQGEVTPYPPAFFAPHSPLTARDMISRIPGFNLDGGSDARGLSGAAGNVLINGERPPGKTDLDDILNRLRANQVARIDLIRGGAPGIDMQGYQLVINIIEAAERGGYSGSAEVGARHVPGVDRLDGSLELIGAREMANGVELDGEISVNHADGEADTPGSRRIRRDADGAFRNAVSSDSDHYEQEISGRLGAAFKLLGGDAKLTGRLEKSEDSRLTTERFTPGSPRRTVQNGEESGGEVGASYDFSLSGGRVQAALSRDWSSETSNSISLSGRPPSGNKDSRDGGEIGVTANYPLSGGARLQSVFAKSWAKDASTSSNIRSDGSLSNETDSEETGETALRTTLFFKTPRDLSFETGVEAAYNFLKGSSELTLDGVPQNLTGSQAKVDEKRGEVFGVATWEARPDLTLKGALRYEFSTLTASGVRKELAFAKPLIEATWRPRDDQEVLARVERTLGQLDFGDFLSSASISEFDEFITGGAVDLTPTQDWVSTLRFDQKFWDAGVLTLQAEYRSRKDLIDRRLVEVLDENGDPELIEARGNIGGGKQAFFNADLDAPLDRLGIGGGRLSVSADILLLSELTDPFTGEKRQFAWDRDYNLSLEFEQDFKSWNTTWGFDLRTQSAGINYRRDSVEFSSETPDVSAFLIYRPDPRSTLRLDFNDAFWGHSENVRRVYDGQRDISDIDFIETRRNDRIASVRLTYRRTLN